MRQRTHADIGPGQHQEENGRERGFDAGKEYGGG
jgi:hypothetical protein